MRENPRKVAAFVNSVSTCFSYLADSLSFDPIAGNGNIGMRAAVAGVKPPARADHSCSKWWYCDDGVWKDIMVCFGGSTIEGTQNDVWLFDFRWEE